MSHEIINGETLYRYVDVTAIPAGQTELPTAIFNDPDMSCDWEKLQSSPETSPHVLLANRRLLVSIAVCDEIKNPTNPKRVGDVVAAWKQEVIHAPEIYDEARPSFTPNNAHALVKGKKKQAVADAIKKNSTYRII